MKMLFSSFVILSMLLVTGCTENPVTDPVSPGDIQRANIPEITSTVGSIPLGGIVKYPGAGNTYFTLEGSISYNIQLIPGNSVPADLRSIDVTDKKSDTGPASTATSYYVRVALYADATLTSSDLTLQNDFYVSSGSVNYLYKSVDGNYKLAKSYAIEGRNDNLSLACRFVVTDQSIKLDSRWLEFVVSHSGSYTN